MTTHTQDAQHMPLSKVDKLRQDAAEAAGVRAFQTHPDVVALRVESVRSQVDALMWVGIVLGLAFTMVNVQTFAAGSARPFTLAWFAAWLLDPMVSLVLIAVLRAEQVTARYQVPTGTWVRRTKVFAFAATYVMNTWASWSVLNPAGIVLHSVPAVFMNPTPHAAVNAAPADGGTVQDVPAGPVHERRTPTRRPARKPVRKPTGRRKLRADYMADARNAWTPGVHVTPAWVREVTDCSRGMSSQVAADL